MRRALVIGCGLSGAVVARELAEAGYNVQILERRDHIGGNLYDYHDEHGILVHKYGPHTFHTNDRDIYEYIKKYADWVEYKLCCGAFIDGVFSPTPFNFTTVDIFWEKEKSADIKNALKETFPGRVTVTVLEILKSQNKLVREFGEFLYKKDYSLYTAKQWGVSPEEIDPSVLKRVPIRLSYETGYFDDTYQVMPKISYTDFFRNILNHKNISVELNVDANQFLKLENETIFFKGSEFRSPVIYTGPVDELFKHIYGKLPYRSLKFVWKYSQEDSIQPVAVVAYPQEKDFTRIVEFKKLPFQNVCGSSYEIEYPLQYDPKKNQEPYYPVMTEDSLIRYSQYKDLVKNIPNLYCIGRLGEFKYYNMDQVISNALEMSRIIKENDKNEL